MAEQIRRPQPRLNTGARRPTVGDPVRRRLTCASTGRLSIRPAVGECRWATPADSSVVAGGEQAALGLQGWVKAPEEGRWTFLVTVLG